MRKVQLEVRGRRPPGRLKNNWKTHIEEELTKLNLQNEQANDIHLWLVVIDRFTTIKEDSLMLSLS